MSFQSEIFEACWLDNNLKFKLTVFIDERRKCLFSQGKL